MPQEKDIASDCTSFATALGHAAPAAAQPASFPASFPASATAPHTLTGEIDALKAVSKAVRDLDSLNLTQRKLFDRIEHTHNNIFIQGQAGTGKSTFIKYLKKHSKKRIRLVAPTAIAALNIEVLNAMQEQVHAGNG